MFELYEKSGRVFDSNIVQSNDRSNDVGDSVNASGNSVSLSQMASGKQRIPSNDTILEVLDPVFRRALEIESQDTSY